MWLVSLYCVGLKIFLNYKFEYREIAYEDMVNCIHPKGLIPPNNSSYRSKLFSACDETKVAHSFKIYRTAGNTLNSATVCFEQEKVTATKLLALHN